MWLRLCQARLTNLLSNEYFEIFYFKVSHSIWWHWLICHSFCSDIFLSHFSVFELYTLSVLPRWPSSVLECARLATWPHRFFSRKKQKLWVRANDDFGSTMLKHTHTKGLWTIFCDLQIASTWTFYHVLSIIQGWQFLHRCGSGFEMRSCLQSMGSVIARSSLHPLGQICVLQFTWWMITSLQGRTPAQPLHTSEWSWVGLWPFSS